MASAAPGIALDQEIIIVPLCEELADMQRKLEFIQARLAQQHGPRSHQAEQAADAAATLLRLQWQVTASYSAD